MKKFLIFALVSAFVLTLGACAKKTQLSEIENPVDGEMTGAWQLKEDMTVTDEVKELLGKATADLDGAAYEPVAYVASQVVSGRNHLLLCTITPVIPDGQARYALVTLYQDLQGNVTITEVLDCESTEGAAGLLLFCTCADGVTGLLLFCIGADGVAGLLLFCTGGFLGGIIAFIFDF